MPIRNRNGSRVVIVALFAALFAAACLDNVAAVIPEPWRWPARFLAGVLATAGLARAMRRRIRRFIERTVQELNTREGCGPSRQDIYDSAERVREKYPPEETGTDQKDQYSSGDPEEEQPTAIDIFAFLLMDGGHVARVSEDVQVSGDMLINDVTIEVSLEVLNRESQKSRPRVPDKGPVVIPILRRKEVMLESFEVRDGADNRLTQLPQHLTDGLLAWAVMGLYRMVYAAPDTELTAAQRSTVYRLIGLICRTDIINSDEFAQAYDAIVGNPPAHGDEDPALLRSFCAYFAANTVSAVEVAVSDADQIYVKYRDVTTNDRLDTAHDRQRTRLGIRPYRYRIPINFAYGARIYDLRITGPESHFVHKHYLSQSTPDGMIDVKPSDLATKSGMGVRLDRNQGVPYTGLHTRGLNRVALPRDLECVAEFEEIPPGTLRRTLVISSICSFVTFAFAFAMPSAIQDSRGTDLAALLLAVPGFAATLVGISTDRVQQSSLTTFGGLVVSATISFATSVLYVMQSLVWRASPAVQLRILGMITLPRADVIWLLFAALSLSTTVYLAVEGTYRMHRYMSALRRRTTAALSS